MRAPIRRRAHDARSIARQAALLAESLQEAGAARIAPSLPLGAPASAAAKEERKKRRSAKSGVDSGNENIERVAPPPGVRTGY